MGQNGAAPWTEKDAKRLKVFRIGREWSQARLAEELGCDQGTVSRIEGGYPPPRPIRRLIEILTNERRVSAE